MTKLLLVDDQRLLRDAIATLLSLEPDFEVVATAQSGADAIEKLNQFSVDVVVTDIEMHDIDGLTLAEFIQANFPAIKTMILTTFSKARYIQRSQQANVQAYLLKDASPDVLATSIRRVRQGEVVIAPELLSQVWRANITPLSDAECRILQLSLSGLSTKEIADKIHLSHGTVRNYAQTACQKLQAKNRIEACAKAQRMGWI